MHTGREKEIKMNKVYFIISKRILEGGCFRMIKKFLGMWKVEYEIILIEYIKDKYYYFPLKNSDEIFEQVMNLPKNSVVLTENVFNLNLKELLFERKNFLRINWNLILYFESDYPYILKEDIEKLKDFVKGGD